MAENVRRWRAYTTLPGMAKVKTTFTDKVVVITGASSGIGRETTRAFEAAGARVVPASRSSTPSCDVTRDADVTALFAEVERRFGRLDILVNNAGIGIRATVANTRPDDARHLMEVNFFGALRCTRAALPLLKKSPAPQIVNIGSILSVLATPRNSFYCASKHALRAWGDALRIELRDANIEVISVLPGYTDTPFFENQVRYGGPARVTSLKGQHPGKVARAILRACACHKRDVVLTVPGQLGVWMKRFAPRLLDCFLRHLPR
jgi:NAD(P)-dependent dehydrogenase (short-subunit alcohol dehydrogenase family)